MEVWKTITGYPDYQVSNFGNVKSFKRKRELILKPMVSRKGYLKVDLEDK